MFIEAVREWRASKGWLTNLHDPARWLLAALYGGGYDTGSGMNVSPRSVLELSPALRAIRLICESLSMAPVNLLEKTAAKRQVLDEDPVHFLVHDEPNEMMSAPVFLQTVQLHALTEGNGYSFIERNSFGLPVALLPLDSMNVQPTRENGRFFYRIFENNKTFEVSPADMLHIPWLSWSGIKGESPALIGKRSIGLGMAAEESGARFFGKGMLQNLIIEQTPGTTLASPALEQLKEAITAKWTGIENLWRPLMLQPGLTAKPISVDPDKAQAREIRELNVADCARIWGVPLALLASLETGAQSYASVEQFALMFVKHTMLPWFVVWEKELARKLIPRAMRAGATKRFFKFNADVLMRGDLLSRMQAHQIAINTGLETVNEGRAVEDRDPYAIPEADEPLVVASNLAPLAQIGKQQPGESPLKEAQRLAQLYAYVLNRCVRQMCDTAAKLAEKHRGQRERFAADLGPALERIESDYSGLVTPEGFRAFRKQLLAADDPSAVIELWRATGYQMISGELQ